jgi:pectin methylesterase-like acyl-CoA thioesterase
MLRNRLQIFRFAASTLIFAQAGSLAAQSNPAWAMHKRRVLKVVADNSGDFRSVQEAVNALPEDGGEIHIAPGTYREVVHITKPHVRLEGDVKDPSKVVIVFNKSHGTAGGTLASASVSVDGDDFYAQGITFANDFSVNKPLAEGSQAVALLVRGDRAVLRHVRLLGFQDTLYTGSKSCTSEQGPCVPTRQYFSDCYIEGNVDFIFGDARTVFQNCEIHALPNSVVFLTAQSKHYPQELSGYVFDHCKVTAAPGTPKIYLGRPWRAYSTVVFLNTDIQAKIDPAGWREWTPEKTHKLETSFYAEFGSHGLGGDIRRRDPHAKQMQREDANGYRAEVFLAGADHWNAVSAH